MSALPDRDHGITLTEAAEMTRRWRRAYPKAEKAGAFHADQVKALLEQPGCAALRYYHALNEDGSYAIILVAVDHAGCDMADGILMERHYPCPPMCDGFSDLAASAWVARARNTVRTDRLIPA
jgi:hypothetical protein